MGTLEMESKNLSTYIPTVCMFFFEGWRNNLVSIGISGKPLIMIKKRPKAEIGKEIQNLKVLQGEETKREILRVARKLFGRKGFHQTSIEDVIAELNLTKGALYHHFKNKKEIFHEVCKLLNMEASLEFESLEWQEFKASIVNIWERAEDPEFVQIWIRDCYSVLSTNEIFELDEKYIIKPLQIFLERMAEQKYIASLPSLEESHMMIGMVYQGLWLVSTSSKKEKSKVKQNLNKVLLAWISSREIKK